jgi:type I restriction enzyme S subunit
VIEGAIEWAEPEVRVEVAVGSEAQRGLGEIDLDPAPRGDRPPAVLARGVEDALREACPIRLRPILMTSISTIAAALPPALAMGPGAEVAPQKMPVPLPKPSEQRAIATALSDVDGLLGGLDKLIAKKRDLKQAAMQQLLIGHTRLPGWDGAWEVKRLGDVLTVRHGKSQHGITAPDGKYPILASGGEIGRTNAHIYDQPSVLIGRKGTIDSPQYVDSPFWTVDTLFFTEISSEADAKFVFYKFTMIRWRSYNEASGVPSLNAKTIENIEVSIPPLPEQTAIAEVLTEMDGELAMLEQRREKTRALKQAMMHSLLTGSVRLV